MFPTVFRCHTSRHRSSQVSPATHPVSAPPPSYFLPGRFSPTRTFAPGRICAWRLIRPQQWTCNRTSQVAETGTFRRWAAAVPRGNPRVRARAVLCGRGRSWVVIAPLLRREPSVSMNTSFLSAIPAAPPQEQTVPARPAKSGKPVIEAEESIENAPVNESETESTGDTDKADAFAEMLAAMISVATPAVETHVETVQPAGVETVTSTATDI